MNMNKKPIKHKKVIKTKGKGVMAGKMASFGNAKQMGAGKKNMSKGVGC